MQGRGLLDDETFGKGPANEGVGVTMSDKSASDVWRPAFDAHAIVYAAAIIQFNEHVTSVSWQQIIEIGRSIANSMGLTAESEMQTVTFSLESGALPKPEHDPEPGIEFVRMSASNQPIEKITLERNSLRIDTGQYTRWEAFKDLTSVVFNAILPQYLNLVRPTTLSLEYRDMFRSHNDGQFDVGLIVEKNSPYFDGSHFNMRDIWHSNRGWFEDATENARLLVNVDIASQFIFNGKDRRHGITVRTFESVRSEATNGAFGTAAEAMDMLDTLHSSLKNRFSDILTADARSMVGLGGENG